MMRAALLSIAICANAFAVAGLQLRHDDNDGIHLAISPPCGSFGGNVTNVNSGIDLRNMDTIVSFGDSYTDGGAHDGGPLPLPIVPVNGTRAGGRITNGYVWIEHLANMTGRRGALLMDYAVQADVVWDVVYLTMTSA